MLETWYNHQIIPVGMYFICHPRF